MENKSHRPMQDPVAANETFVDYQTYIEPFVGWRAWNITIETGDKIRLRSITHQKLWIPEVPFEAKCLPTMWNKKSERPVHAAPHKECGCGIHAVMDKEGAMEWHGFGNSMKMRCIGEVKLWGVVFRYTRGYLAQFAYPKELWVPHDVPEDFPIDSRECVKELRRTYRGVKVSLL